MNILFYAILAASFGYLTSVDKFLIPFIIVGLIYYLANLSLSIKKRGNLSLYAVNGIVLVCSLTYWVLRQESAIAYNILSSTALIFSNLAGALCARQLNMGLTYSGIDLAFLFIFILLITRIFNQEKIRRYYIIDIIALPVIWLVYMSFWTVLAENSLALRLNLLEPLTGPLDFRIFLFVLYSLYYIVMTSRYSSQNLSKAISFTKETHIKSLRLITITAAISLLLLIITWLPISTPSNASGANITFWDTGLDFSVPNQQKFGLDYAGMFGVLPKYLTTQGYNCATVTELTDEVFKKTDLLVIINPYQTPDTETLTRIWSYVQAGGSVLTVGDHTGYQSIRLPLNTILKPVSIAYNFDSAIPFQSLWPEGLTMRRSPIFSGLSPKNLQLVVGASLDIGANVKPLLIGRNGYSDRGDVANVSDGYLGDMSFSRGERVGDLILAAESSYGKGRFVSFGDTTFLQNTVLAYSYPLIDNLFAYLVQDSSVDSGQELSEQTAYASFCYIDASHVPSFDLDKSGNGVDGLIANILRAQMMPCVIFERGELIPALAENAKILIIIEPALRYNTQEKEALNRFIAQGGLVILCGGNASPDATKKLASHWSFAYENMPIGRIAPEQNPAMAFWNAYPLFNVQISDSVAFPSASLMDVWGNSVITRQEMDQGSLYMIGDGDFLKNKNLEDVDTYREGNIEFLTRILADNF